MQTVDPSVLVTTREAADLLKVDPRSVCRLIADGSLVAVVRRLRLTRLDGDLVRDLAALRESGAAA